MAEFPQRYVGAKDYFRTLFPKGSEVVKTEVLEFKLWSSY
jgi:hypothetical protein